MNPESFDKPLRRTIFRADLKCYMCGSVAGSIESEQAFAEAALAHRPVLLRRAGLPQQVMPVLNWRTLRCDRCGGPLFLDEVEAITRRFEDYNWLDERPRRGRPPKRLIEERRRERELLESEQREQPAAA
jgi:hypothetical protein